MNYVPNTEQQRTEMLRQIGVKSIDELFRDIPEKLFLKEGLGVGKPLSEPELTAYVKAIAAKNANASDYAYFLGAGMYNHFIPSVVPHLALRSEFYTAYTPYQPEISQGNLQAIYEWQTMVAELTGQDIANASVYDGASATADAMLMAHHSNGKKEVLVAKTLNPDYRKVLKTYADANEFKVVEVGHENGCLSMRELEKSLGENTSVVVLQSPNFFGCIENVKEIVDAAHAKGALVAVAVTEPISFGSLKPPGECGADFVSGEGQSFGIPMSFGGPGVGFLAIKEKFVRVLPGRLSGKTVDSEGKTGYILTLQAREQHIRREKSISNICTNQGLFALMASVYLTAMGKNGVKKVAELNLQKAHYAAEKIAASGAGELVFAQRPFFNEFVVKLKDVKKASKALLKNMIVPGYDLGAAYPELKNCMLFAVTEMNAKEQIDTLARVLGGLK